MRQYIFLAASVALMASCLDTTVLPVDKTLEEDFWKNKSEVQQMVNGAYQSMTSEAVMKRVVVWGELKGDNVNPTVGITSSSDLTALEEVNTMNNDDKNMYSDWTALYDVINRCNIVLAHAEGVMSIDPSYSEGNYQSDCSQVLALRALAYFYLVRAFRDVPYTSEAYQNSSQFMELPQSSPDSVLTSCIKDLERVEMLGLAPKPYTDWRRCGVITRDGIRAILADIYLWRASMNKSAADYQKCIEYCDKVIESKREMSEDRRMQMTSDMVEGYPLYNYENAFQNIFIGRNSEESIFELQMNGTWNLNRGVRDMYYMYKKDTQPGFLQGSQIMGITKDDKNGISTDDNVFVSKYDVRFWESSYGVNNNNSEAFSIRKMVGQSQKLFSATESQRPYSSGSSSVRQESYDRFNQNWIFYRLSDIMLMKAEALTQLADASASAASDASLGEAFNLVQAVYKRSLANGGEGDSLLIADYDSREDMEMLVLCERQRELCYEGKRWFDLVRYSYRHMEGVNPRVILSEYTKKSDKEDGKEEPLTDINQYPAIYDKMISLLSRKYLENSGVLSYQLTTEPKLYFPVHYNEVKVNPNIVQNPGYKSGSEYEKNY